MVQSSSITRFLLAVAAIVVIFAGVKLSSQIIVPFLLSLFIAIICSPIIRFMTKHNVPLGVAIAMLLLLIVVVFFFLAGMVGSAVAEFTASIPQYRILLSQRINDILAFAHQWNIPFSISQESVLEQLDPSVIMNFVSRILLSFSGVVTNVFVLLLVVVLMLLEAPTMKHKLALAMASDPNKVEVEERYINRVLASVIGYLGIKTITSILTGLAVWCLLEILGVQYAVLWATLSFLLNYIPNIGSIIATLPIIVQALLLNSLSVAVGATVGLILLNMVIGNIIEPKMMGRRLGLSTLVVFLSLLFWGWLLGTVGMFLSVPLTVSLKIALESSLKTVRYAYLLGEVDENTPSVSTNATQN